MFSLLLSAQALPQFGNTCGTGIGAFPSSVLFPYYSNINLMLPGVQSLNTVSGFDSFTSVWGSSVLPYWNNIGNFHDQFSPCFDTFGLGLAAYNEAATALLYEYNIQANAIQTLAILQAYDAALVQQQSLILYQSLLNTQSSLSTLYGCFPGCPSLPTGPFTQIAGSSGYIGTGQVGGPGAQPFIC